MDAVVLGAVVVVLTMVVYFLATLGTRETPFEEAIAEQRMKRDQENAQSKSDKQQHKKPKGKKLKPAKKEEVEATGAAPAEADPEPEPEPEPASPPQADPESTSPPVQEKKKEKKKKKDKDREVEEGSRKLMVEEVVEETLAKTEASKVETGPPVKAQPPPPAPKSQNPPAKAPTPPAKAPTPPAKAPTPPAKAPTPPAKAPTPPAKAPTPPAKASTPPAPVKEATAVKEVKEAVEAVVTAEVQESSLTTAAPPEKQPSPQEKKKKDKSKNDIPMNETKLIPMVQRAPLSGTEIQTLIDVLLNKQQQNNAGGDWVKKGRMDPITQLKKQLEEAENRLRDKDEAHSALSAKITDLCAELHGEKSRYSKLKTQLDDSLTNYNREKENAATHSKAAQVAQTARRTLEQEYQAKLLEQQKLVEKLQGESNESEVASLRTALSEAEMQAKMIRQEHEELTQRLQHYEEHIKSQEEKRAGEDVTRSTQLSDLQAKLQSTDAARAQALAQLAVVDGERDALTQKLAAEGSKLLQLQHNLQEKLHEKAEVDSRLIQVESELCSVRQVMLDQGAQIERLKEEKESLASQIVRPAAEGQENGDVRTSQSPTPDTALLDNLIKEKERIIEEQVSEVASLKKEIARLKEDLEHQREKNNRASEEVETEKARVREVLRRICPEVAVDDSLDQGVFLSEFEKKALQVSTQTVQQPEPQVVEKVVEVVKEVEVKVEDPALKSQLEQLTKENAELKTQVAGLQKAAEEAVDIERVSELEEEVRAVNDKVTHYQTVLADTENLLKSLQASVESEEAAWNKRLTEKENRLKELTADKANLQLQIKQLEDTVEKAQQSQEMQQQLDGLRDKLKAEEKEKMTLLEDLQKAQEQLAQTASQTSSTNGPVSEEQCQEDEAARADTASLLSTSSASVTDTNPSQVQSDTAKKPKKKRKGAGAIQ